MTVLRDLLPPPVEPGFWTFQTKTGDRTFTTREKHKTAFFAVQEIRTEHRIDPSDLVCVERPE